MGFFAVEQARSDDFLRGVSVEFLHQHQCKACPLANQVGLAHPHMDPHGSTKPLVYMLGEAPGAEDDKRGRHFAGESGRVLRFRIPERWNDDIRFNNCVRTRSSKNATPQMVAIECCRPSVQADIERTKPKAIFGFGNVPLKWAINQNGITLWCGRRVPVRIGKHKCWFYPIMDPTAVLISRRFTPQRTREYGSDEEFVFASDLQRAFDEVEAGLPEPIVHSVADAIADVMSVDGSGGWRDVERVVKFLKACYRDPVVGFDWETTRLRPYSKGAKILSFAASGDTAGTMAVALYHREAQWTDKQREAVLDALEDFLYEAPCLRVAHNLTFELEWGGYFFGREAVRAGAWGDSISQAYILDERQGMLKLGILTLQYFGINIKTISNVDTAKLDSTPVGRVLTYNGMDAKYHRLLYQAQAERIRDEGLQDVYDQQLRRVPTMVLTQLAGVPVDMDENASLIKRFGGEIDAIEAEIKELKCVKAFRKKKGRDFAPGSNPDVLYMMRHVLGRDVSNSDKEVLKGVDHVFGELMLEYREAQKILSTYLEPLRPTADRKYSDSTKVSCVFPDGLMHPIVSVVKTRTWRTSSEDPNVQNWPKRENKEIRRQVRHKYKKVVSFDYAGIQARNVAMESLDKKLVAAFWDRYDIHSDWMERLIQLYPRWVKEGVKTLAKDDDLRKKYRNVAKNKLVFPLFFGSQAKSCARNLGVPENVGLELSEEFWDRFSGIKKWQERTRTNYEKDGYVTGLSGFRRRAPVAWTEIINTPIQSDEAAIVCDAMNRLSEIGEPRYQATLEIHDDLTFIWDADEIDRNAEVVISAMLGVPFEWAHSVPIGVEMSIGDNWADQKGVGEFFSDHWNGKFKREH